MNCSESFNAASSQQEADDCYCSGNFKMTATLPMDMNSSNDSGPASTIFDQPDFVIDAYLDAKNGVSQKDEGIRCLSTKYCETETEGNFNCNHNPSDGGCGCNNEPEPDGCGCSSKDSHHEHSHGHGHGHTHSHKHGHCHTVSHDGPKTCHKGDHDKWATHDDSAKCGCSDSIYEEGSNAFVEFPKKHCSKDECPYEEGASPFEEKPKRNGLGIPYDSTNSPFKDCNDPKPAKPACACPVNVVKPCSGKSFSEFETEGEETSLVVTNVSNNNLQCSLDAVVLPAVHEVLETMSSLNEDDEVPFEVLEEDTLALEDELGFKAKDKSDDARSCALC